MEIGRFAFKGVKVGADSWSGEVASLVSQHIYV